MAVMTLPPEMMVLYKENIEFITEESVAPDRRRYSYQDEAPRHYIDLDHYGVYPFDSLPRYWNDAVAKYSEDTLMKHGIVPWYVVLMMYKLEEAFKVKDKYKILRYSADIGHYIADAHVPLHSTSNYNGQKTNQVGIHGFWESRIPELFAEDYDFFVGKPEYIRYPQTRIWKVVLESASEVDSVLQFERALNESFPSDQKFSFESRGETTVKVYSESYSKAYELALNGMIEKRMRSAIKTVADFWFTAWVNAGQPDLSDLVENPLSEEELKQMEEEKINYMRGILIGRDHQD